MLACTVLLEGSSKWEALKKGGTFVLPKAQFTLTNKLQRQQFRSPTLHKWQTMCYLHRKVQEGEVIQPKQFGFKQMPLVRHHKTPSKNRTKKRVRKHRFYPFSIYKKAPLGHPLSLHDAQGSCALESTTVAPNASKETSRRPSGISAPPRSSCWQKYLAQHPQPQPRCRSDWQSRSQASSSRCPSAPSRRQSARPPARVAGKGLRCQLGTERATLLRGAHVTDYRKQRGWKGRRLREEGGSRAPAARCSQAGCATAPQG